MDIVTIRASSLAELFDCPARWEAKHILGMRMPSSGASHLGTAVHAGTAAFDQAVLDGAPITADDAAAAVVDSIHDKDAEVDWEDSDPATAERIALALHTRYCVEIAPRQHYIGVEVKCERLEIPELGLALTGTTDRVRTTEAGAGISDLKTGGRAVGTDGVAVTAGHGPQLGVYELLAEHAMGIPISAPAQIVGMNTGKTAAGQRVGTGEIESPRTVLLGTEDQPGLLQHASRLIQSGAFYGNGKSFLCSAKYCPRHATCPYKS
ncbi:nuclease [Cupriavidus sp. USMAA2-4]|uniref:RecB family exonuclease n=1 Tax=Cupriavidus sp. USMAA2-4 TaxID=876364 RepID=UPI0008A7049F|nr:PD-(D/E)XK nuclease family protein [Cupriavidus sp. USMAA2-4]AOY93803.1 nuclease [Cupriavidus sp. USMAA2-4]